MVRQVKVRRKRRSICADGAVSLPVPDLPIGYGNAQACNPPSDASAARLLHINAWLSVALIINTARWTKWARVFRSSSAAIECQPDASLQITCE